MHSKISSKSPLISLAFVVTNLEKNSLDLTFILSLTDLIIFLKLSRSTTLNATPLSARKSTIASSRTFCVDSLLKERKLCILGCLDNELFEEGVDFLFLHCSYSS